MKLNKKVIENVGNYTRYERIIACAAYLSVKDPKGEGVYGDSMHEKIATLVISGHDIHEIMEKTGYTEGMVKSGINDIRTYVANEKLGG